MTHHFQRDQELQEAKKEVRVLQVALSNIHDMARKHDYEEIIEECRKALRMKL